MFFKRKIKCKTLLIIALLLVSLSSFSFVGGGGGGRSSGSSSRGSSSFGGGSRGNSYTSPVYYSNDGEYRSSAFPEMTLYDLGYLLVFGFVIYSLTKFYFLPEKQDFSSVRERNYYINRCAFSKVIPCQNHSYTEFLDRADYLNRAAIDTQAKSKFILKRFISQDAMYREITFYFSELQAAWCAKNKKKLLKLCSLGYCKDILLPQLNIMKKYKVNNIIKETVVEDIILIECIFEPLRKCHELAFVITGNQIDEYVLQERADTGAFNSKPFNCIVTAKVYKNSIKIKNIDISNHVYDDIADRYFRAQKAT